MIYLKLIEKNEINFEMISIIYSNSVILLFSAVCIASEHNKNNKTYEL